MKTIQVAEAKAKFSAILADAEAGETIQITRHGRVVAELGPCRPLSALDVIRGAVGALPDPVDIHEADDPPPRPVRALK